MATPNNESLKNANRLQKGQLQLMSNLAGITTNLAIYDLDFEILKNVVKGLDIFISNDPDNDFSIAHEWNQFRRANHRDDNGNLPHIINNGQAYCEFHLESNGMPHPSHIRLIYDTEMNDIFITPSHYDPWQDNDDKDRNPFYRIVNLPDFVFGGTPVFE